MPLLLRATAPSPSIDELAFAATAPPLSSQRSASSTKSELPLCAAHDRSSVRRRRSTAGTYSEVSDWLPSTGSGFEHTRVMRRCSRQSRSCGGGVATTSKDTAGDADKRSSRDTQLDDDDDDHCTSGASFASEAGRISSALSCSCSCADANEFAITSSSVVIEGRQLAVVDKELRDLRTTLVRKLYTRLTKITGLGRRKASPSKSVA
ncbi:unnamed protein product [Hyaloperonospora brassicae]|uniref:RxLR effector candidate protein n=1 Tax=Hyaloperonospora brassicae TaxID=162125 RepID=A0AAV0TTE9_HYABA|nr:unnamed protein product [Hyaloperonospora brassicae]